MDSGSKPMATTRSHSANRRVYIIGCLCIAITIAAACLSIGLLRRDQIAEQMDDVNDLAVVLAAQAARSFQAVELVVQEIRDMAVAAGAADPQSFRETMATKEVHRLLVERLRSLAQAVALTIIDSTG